MDTGFSYINNVIYYTCNSYTVPIYIKSTEKTTFINLDKCKKYQKDNPNLIEIGDLSADEKADIIKKLMNYLYMFMDINDYEII